MPSARSAKPASCRPSCRPSARRRPRSKRRRRCQQNTSFIVSSTSRRSSVRSSSACGARRRRSPLRAETLRVSSTTKSGRWRPSVPRPRTTTARRRRGRSICSDALRSWLKLRRPHAKRWRTTPNGCSSAALSWTACAGSPPAAQRRRSSCSMNDSSSWTRSRTPLPLSASSSVNASLRRSARTWHPLCRACRAVWWSSVSPRRSACTWPQTSP
mmetsp:Transcript_125115/g.348155  ORF Transcript_125115/g.348155 Transcript_125115/m.348155 type:complete len:214 (-) Transcript_125115:2207-2848(-)